MIYALSFIGGYLLGSIPFGLVLCRIAGYGDIRNIGSGNIGATNVLRTGNKPLAMATLLLDSGKGAIAVIIAYMLIDFNAAMLAGFAALLGHCYPVWLKFKGGKGVATTLGTLLALQPLLGGIACGLWFLMALIFRISSLSALIAIGLTPIIAHYLYNDPNLSGFCAAITALVYLKHRENIKRIFKGEEPKIGQKKKA
jgi:glycerol-3-phosphate acyltransferase PlsY